ncbi:hypothetical protein KP77_25390 [Jeotgalibacillus alimentarius]|uniref:DnaD domain-containing protein n=1 Tax=Jeotgalibacillus alimentarius TaxID=135826 RepID=A0A0C2R9G8_9BACL|nr:hypothetical protein [Jeotgalibacillus alimentarius]KIL46970.1 hypothetical protein KP77_25390 [Jeotgalibacillus alimentarius]
MAGGAFQISREIFDNDIWQDPIKFRIFFYLVGKAVFDERGVQQAGITLKRGQYLRSLSKLQHDLSYKENNSVAEIPLTTLRRKLDELENEGRIARKQVRIGTVFTINNYYAYQGLQNYSRTEVTEEKPKQVPSPTPQLQRQNNLNQQQELLNKFIQLRAKGTETTPKDQMAAEKILKDMPLSDALHWLEERFKAYQPKHNFDRIKALEYCAGWMLDRYQESKNSKNGGGTYGDKKHGRSIGESQEPSITGGRTGRIRRKG